MELIVFPFTLALLFGFVYGSKINSFGRRVYIGFAFALILDHLLQPYPFYGARMPYGLSTSGVFIAGVFGIILGAKLGSKIKTQQKDKDVHSH